MQKSVLYLIGCCLVVCLCTPSVSAQKKQFYGVLPKKEVAKDAVITDDLDNLPTTEKQTKTLQPWLQKPYLQTEPSKATVQDMMVAAQLWREKNVPLY